MEGWMNYRIKDLAQQIDRTPRTIKTWEKRRYLPLPRRDSRGWRVYSDSELKEIVKMVKENNYFIQR